MEKVKKFLFGCGRFAAFVFILFILFWLFYFLFVRSWHIGWQADKTEINRFLPGDSLVINPKSIVTRAISIKTAPDKVWQWLIQTGRGRSGFYSYEWLENLFGIDLRNVFEILPDKQIKSAGDGVEFAPGFSLPVSVFEPRKAIVINSNMVDSASSIKKTFSLSWGFILESKPDGTTRFITRWRMDINDYLPEIFTYSLTTFFFTEPAHFIMERKMLMTIKNLAEHGSPYSDSIFESELVSVIALIAAFIGILIIYAIGKERKTKIFLASANFILLNMLFWFWYTNTLISLALIILTGVIILLQLKLNLGKRKIPQPAENP